MNDVAVLGLGFDARELDEANRKLDRLSQTSKSAEQATGRLSGAAGSATAVLARFGTTLAGGLSLGIVSNAIMSAVDHFSKLGEAARKAGVDVMAFQRIQDAARRSGVSTADAATGISKFADLFREIGDKESKLGELFKSNGVALKNRNGDALSFNEALAATADLFARAASESDKIKLAEHLGIAREMIPLLERGGEKIAELGREADESGRIISRELIEKAETFDKAWATAWENFSIIGKGALAEIGVGIAGMIASAASFGQKLVDSLPQSIKDGLARETQTRQAIAAGERMGRLAGPISRGEPIAGDTVDHPMPPLRPVDLNGKPTVIPTGGKGGGGGGGGGGKSEAEQAQDRLNSYTTSIERQTSVLQAQIATFGQSNAVQRAAMEIAKALPDLNKLDASTREAAIEALRKQVDASEAARAKLEELRTAQRQMIEVSDAGRSAFSSIAQDAARGELGINGVTSALGRMRDRLVDMAANNFWDALFGNGKGGGLFNLAGAGGGGGGGGFLSELLGQIFIPGSATMAAGGHVRGPGTGTSDSILARLSNGEFVVNARSAARHRPLLEAINAPAFAGGGYVMPRIPQFQMPANSNSGGGGNVSFQVINNGTPQEAKEVRDEPDGRGGRRITAVMDDMVAGSISRPGSAANRAAKNAFGLRPQLQSG